MNDWISVQNELPPLDVYASDTYMVSYISTTGDQLLGFAFLTDHNGWWRDEEGHIYDVTHWFPHPDLPTI